MFEEIKFITTITIGILLPLIFVYFSDFTKNAYTKYYYELRLKLRFILLFLLTLLVISLYVHFSYKLYIDNPIFNLFRNTKTIFEAFILIGELLILVFVIRVIIRIYSFKKKDAFFQALEALQIYAKKYNKIINKYNWTELKKSIKEKKSNEKINILDRERELIWNQYINENDEKYTIYDVNVKKINRRFKNCWLILYPGDKVYPGKICLFYPETKSINKINYKSDIKFIKRNIKVGINYKYYVHEIMEQVYEDLRNAAIRQHT